MKCKKNVTLDTSDFYYDLFLGGYISPYEYLEKEEDADEVRDAIAVIKEFQDSLVEQEVMEYL